MTASFRLISLALVTLALGSAYSSAHADAPPTGAPSAVPGADARKKAGDKSGAKPPAPPAPAPTPPAPATPPAPPASASPAPPAAPAPTAPAAPAPPAPAPSKHAPSPSAKAPQSQPKAKHATTCTVVTEEAPRGGRLDVSGSGFGQTPIVRIADKVTRILMRTADTISVQIARDSDGGPVTVEASGVRTPCGWLTIIGKDR